MSWVYFLKFKSEIFENFMKCKPFVERQSVRRIKTLRIDRGGEFISNEFNTYCEGNGSHRELATPYTLEQEWCCRTQELDGC